jgi:hypothetical protein
MVGKLLTARLLFLSWHVKLKSLEVGFRSVIKLLQLKYLTICFNVFKPRITSRRFLESPRIHFWHMPSYLVLNEFLDLLLV